MSVTQRPVDVDAADRALADFWVSYVEARRGAVRYTLRHPVRTWRALREIRNLPVIHAHPPADSPGGRAVRAVVDAEGPLGSPARWWASAVLAVPQDPADHLAGRRRQTLRRMIRAAERQGIACRVVGTDEREERLRLLGRANRVEQAHADPQYRVASPRNDDLLDHELWLTAEADGEVLLLAVVPYDGELATLRYFRTLGTGARFSLCRYLATHALVVELSSRGVRWLLDTEAPGAQTNGLRHFQRMVGFRYARLRVGRQKGVAALSLPTAFASLEPCLERVSALPIF